MNDEDELRSIALRLGNRTFDGAWDYIAHYCGLDEATSGRRSVGFRYYDSVGRRPGSALGATDVLAASSIHPVTNEDLRWFEREADGLNGWLDDIDPELGIGGASAEMLRTIAQMATWDTPVSLSLLSKVLHRARPLSIPIVDRPLLELYGLAFAKPNDHFAALLVGLRDDSDLHAAIWSTTLATNLEERTFERLSSLRLIDIILWMEGDR